MLRISKPHLLEILSHCQKAYPHECCGAFLGRIEREERRIEAVRLLTNMIKERSRDRYEVDPRELMTLDREARDAGISIIGFYHSHPDHPERPSATDTERAWSEYSYLIVSVRKGQAEAWRSWRLDGERFMEEEIRTEPCEG